MKDDLRSRCVVPRIQKAKIAKLATLPPSSIDPYARTSVGGNTPH